MCSLNDFISPPSVVYRLYSLLHKQKQHYMCMLGQHSAVAVLLSLLTWATPLSMAHRTNTTNIHLLLLAPFPDKVFKPAYDGGHSLIPSGQLAVEEINSNPSILNGYHLEAIVGDGGCTVSSKSVSQILERVVHRKPDEHIIGIVGPACSEAAQALSELMNRNRIKLPMVTIGNSPVLANSTRYPFTYGIIGTSNEYAELVVKLYMEMMNTGRWTNISIFYDANRLYHLEIYRGVLGLFKSQNISLDSIYASPISQDYLPLEDIIEAGIRIVFVFSSKEPACRLMCRAIKLGMTGPLYQFFFTDRTLSTFQACAANGSDELVFMYNSKKHRCTNDEIVRAMENFIILSFSLEALRLEPNTTRTLSGNTYTEYRNKYEQRLREYNETVEEDLEPTVWASPYYDSVWAIALAANRTLPNLNFDSKLGIWDEDQLTSTFDTLHFRGVSAVIDFNPKTGFSNSTIEISRLEQSDCGNIISVPKGYYNAGALFDSSDYNSDTVVLNLYINSRFTTEPEMLPYWVSILGYILTILVLIATVIYHFLHFYYRHRPSLKAASPRLNHLIFLGCYIIQGSIILDTTEVGFSPKRNIHLFLCYAVIWLENIGVALVFSTLLVKFYRLYLVFLRTYDHRANLSNGKLSLIVMALVAMEIAILTIWTPFKPLTIETIVSFDSSSEPPVNHEKKICMARKGIGTWFQITASTYLAVLILAVVTLSILNRRIKQRDFNTTTATNILVYLYIFLLSILLPSVYVDNNYANIDLKYVLINSVYLTFTILCLVLLFTPPLLMRNQSTRKYSISMQLQKISALIALNRIDSTPSSPTLKTTEGYR